MSDLISKQDAVVRIVDSAIDNILSGRHALTKGHEQAVHDSVRVVLDAERVVDDRVNQKTGCD